MAETPEPKQTPPAAPASYSYATEKYGNAAEILVKATRLDSESVYSAARQIFPVGNRDLPADLHADHDWLKATLGSAEPAPGQGTLRPSCDAMDEGTRLQVEDRIQRIYASLKNRATRAAES